MKRFFRFCVVGGGGFVVDSLVYLLVSIFATPLISRLVSFSAAVFFTYVFNRFFTFESKDKACATEFAKYYANMILGGAINIATFYVAINALDAHPVIGIALGSIAGLFVNFMTSRSLLTES